MEQAEWGTFSLLIMAQGSERLKCPHFIWKLPGPNDQTLAAPPFALDSRVQVHDVTRFPLLPFCRKSFQ